VVKTKAIVLALLGLTPGRQNSADSEIFKLIYWMKYSNFLGSWQRYIVIIAVPMHFSWFYQVKFILRWVLEALSTIVLADKKLYKMTVLLKYINCIPEYTI